MYLRSPICTSAYPHIRTFTIILRSPAVYPPWRAGRESSYNRAPAYPGRSGNIAVLWLYRCVFRRYIPFAGPLLQQNTRGGWRLLLLWLRTSGWLYHPLPFHHRYGPGGKHIPAFLRSARSLPLSLSAAVSALR